MNICKPVNPQSQSSQTERTLVIQTKVFLMKNYLFWLHKPKLRIEKVLKRKRKHLHLFFIPVQVSNLLLVCCRLHAKVKTL